VTVVGLCVRSVLLLCHHITLPLNLATTNFVDIFLLVLIPLNFSISQRHDIWGDDDHHGSHPAYTARHTASASNINAGGGSASSSGGGGGSSGSSRGPMSQQSKTIMGWLTKQK